MFGLWADIRLNLKKGRGDRQKWLGVYEAETHWVYQRFVRPGMTVYDIGAADGDTSLLMAKLVGPAGTVVAFEPDTAAYRQRFDLNLGLNPVLRRRISPRYESVTCIVGDPEFVKIDVDGAELDILRASSAVLDRKRTAFLVEVHTERLRGDVADLLIQHGYVVRHIPHAWWRCWILREGRPRDNTWIGAWPA